MLLLVPTTVTKGGVSTNEETVAILPIDFSVVRKLEPEIKTGNTEIHYHDGRKEIINVPFTQIFYQITKVMPINIPTREGVSNVYKPLGITFKAMAQRGELTDM